jgi:hypothetical protein
MDNKTLITEDRIDVLCKKMGWAESHVYELGPVRSKIWKSHGVSGHEMKKMAIEEIEEKIHQKRGVCGTELKMSWYNNGKELETTARVYALRSSQPYHDRYTEGV